MMNNSNVQQFEKQAAAPDGLADSICRVLIVDDDPRMAQSIQRAFPGRRFESRTVHDGSGMMRLVYEFRPHLMTLDLMLPGESGIDLLRTIRRSRKHDRIKIIAISALPKAKLDLAVSDGADAALAKPFYNIELIEVASRLMSEG